MPEVAVNTAAFTTRSKPTKNPRKKRAAKGWGSNKSRKKVKAPNENKADIEVEMQEEQRSNVDTGLWKAASTDRSTKAPRTFDVNAAMPHTSSGYIGLPSRQMPKLSVKGDTSDKDIYIFEDEPTSYGSRFRRPFPTKV